MLIVTSGGLDALALACVVCSVKDLDIAELVLARLARLGVFSRMVFSACPPARMSSRGSRDSPSF